MPVITFANPKGGVGKSTSALLLACGLSASGANVTVIDGDPNRTIFRWVERASERGAPGFTARELPSDDQVIDLIEETAAASAFVLVDLEGTANLAMSRACSRTDLVVIPLQASPVDARQASRAIGLVRAESKQLRREIAYRMLLTRVNVAIATRDEREIRAQFAAQKIPVFKTPLNERAAFRGMFTHYRSLWDLDADLVNGLERARENAGAYVREATSIVRTLLKRSKRRAA